MRIGLFIVTLLITFCSFSQTTIIVRKEQDEIIAIADTRMSYVGSNKKDTVEKIGYENGIGFAVGGVFFAENFKLPSECCKNAKTYDEAVDSFLAKGMFQVGEHYATLKQEYIDFYKRHMYQVASFAIFFSYENEKYKVTPITFAIGTTISSGKSVAGATIGTLGGACDLDTATFTFGFLNAIRDSVCLDATWRPNPEETAIRLMRKQINDKESSEFVGAPITLITIKKKKIVRRHIDE